MVTTLSTFEGGLLKFPCKNYRRRVLLAVMVTWEFGVSKIAWRLEIRWQRKDIDVLAHVLWQFHAATSSQELINNMAKEGEVLKSTFGEWFNFSCIHSFVVLIRCVMVRRLLGFLQCAMLVIWFWWAWWRMTDAMARFKVIAKCCYCCLWQNRNRTYTNKFAGERNDDVVCRRNLFINGNLSLFCFDLTKRLPSSSSCLHKVSCMGIGDNIGAILKVRPVNNSSSRRIANWIQVGNWRGIRLIVNTLKLVYCSD